MSNAIKVEQRGRNTIVYFTRPEIRSPLSIGVLEEVNAVVSGVRDIDALIFTGTGDVFASGADLREIANVDSDNAREFARRGQELMGRIADLRVATIAVVNGICFGGALDLALACDRRIASAAAVFSHPGANLGIMTGWGGTQRLPRLVGQAIAMELFFTAKRLSSEEALACGLIDELAENALERALERS